MYTPFEQISLKSRIWVYQADRALTRGEVSQVEDSGKKFSDSWEAHGKPLQASMKVFHQQFLVIAANESYNLTTGCSIDSSVGFVRSIAQDLQIDLFDRTKVAFLLNDEVFLAPLKSIKSKVAEGTITEETITFDNMVADKASFEKQWLTPAKNTWLSKYF